jgi:hypothetical protein
MESISALLRDLERSGYAVLSPTEERRLLIEAKKELQGNLERRSAYDRLIASNLPLVIYYAKNNRYKNSPIPVEDRIGYGVIGLVIPHAYREDVSHGRAVRRYSVSLDLASVAGATVADQTFTVPGLRLGSVVVVSPPTLTAGLLLCQALVSADDTLKIRLFNQTGSPIDQAAGTWEIVEFA